MAASSGGYDTVQDKAVDALLDSHGYTSATVTPCGRGSVKVEAERTALRWNGRLRLDARVTRKGTIVDLQERDW